MKIVKEIVKEIVYYLKIVSMYVGVFLIFFGILWWISVMARADYKHYVETTATVEKSDYYICVDQCEEEHLINN